MTVPLLDEDGAHADADGDDGFPLEMDFKRHVITIDTVVDKSAAGMASASLRSIEALAEPIDGLFERILAASIGAVVDHAALAEGRELFEKAKATLEEEAAGGGGGLEDGSDAMRCGRLCLLYVVLGDRFHKTQLVIDAATSSLGLGRGADDMNAGQALYDLSYFFRANPTVTGEDSTAWFGKRVNLPPMLCKQRWETNAKAADDALKKIRMRLPSNPLFCYHPHFLLLDQAPKCRKGEWQFGNIGRQSRFLLDPRALVHLVFMKALHDCYQQPVNKMDRVPTEFGPSGHDMPMCLETTFSQFLPLWTQLASPVWLDMPCMSTIKAAIEDLKEYNCYQIKIDGVWIKLSVADCVLLERGWASNIDMTLHGHCFYFRLRAASGNNAHIFPATDSHGAQHQIRRTEYLLERPEGGKYARDEVVSMVTEQLAAGLKKGYSKFLELHTEYQEYPVAFNFLLAPSFRKEFASFAIEVYKRKKECPLKFADAAGPTPSNRFATRARAMTPELLTKHEDSLVEWMDHLELSGVEWEGAWVTASSSDTVDMKRDLPKFRAKIRRTAGALGHTSYIAETLWAIQRELDNYNDTNATTKLYVKFKFNFIAPINMELKYMRTSREEVEELRQKTKKSIRPRATHTNWQRVALCVKLKQKVEGRYDGVKMKSRQFYRNTKKSALSDEVRDSIKRVGDKKTKQLSEEMVELLTGQLELMENERAHIQSKGSNVQDGIKAVLMKQAHWATSNVNNDDIHLEARQAFPHLGRLLMLRGMDRKAGQSGEEESPSQTHEWESRCVNMDRFVEKAGDKWVEVGEGGGGGDGGAEAAPRAAAEEAPALPPPMKRKLVGKRIEVLWEGEWFPGTVTKYFTYHAKKEDNYHCHEVVYDDATEPPERLNLDGDGVGDDRRGYRLEGVQPQPAAPLQLPPPQLPPPRLPRCFALKVSVNEETLEDFRSTPKRAEEGFGVPASDLFSSTYNLVHDRSGKKQQTYTAYYDKSRASAPQVRNFCQKYLTLLGGRCKKPHGALPAGSDPDMYPKRICPACSYPARDTDGNWVDVEVRHSGHFRCFLTPEDDRSLLEAFVNPVSKTLRDAEKKRKDAIDALVSGALGGEEAAPAAAAAVGEGGD